MQSHTTVAEKLLVKLAKHLVTRGTMVRGKPMNVQQAVLLAQPCHALPNPAMYLFQATGLLATAQALWPLGDHARLRATHRNTVSQERRRAMLANLLQQPVRNVLVPSRKVLMTVESVTAGDSCNQARAALSLATRGTV